jgi:hypothetical protein
MRIEEKFNGIHSHLLSYPQSIVDLRFSVWTYYLPSVSWYLLSAVYRINVAHLPDRPRDR